MIRFLKIRTEVSELSLALRSPVVKDHSFFVIELFKIGHWVTSDWFEC